MDAEIRLQPQILFARPSGKPLRADDERPARIERRKVLVSGSEPTYSITYEDKTYDRKPARVPKGATLKAIHTYVFYGWAAC